MQRRNYLAVLALLAALSSVTWANLDFFQVKPQLVYQPDGTEIEAWLEGWHGDWYADGYVFVGGGDGWWYYAELNARGDYVASPHKVRVDDPVEIGIPRYLQRSAVRQAEKDAEYIISYEPYLLIQPDGTEFFAYPDCTLPSRPYPPGTGGGSCSVPADGYVITIGHDPLINYNGGDPFWAFVYDDESGWYYYAKPGNRGDYVASPYKVGLDDPPGYNPAVTPGRSALTAVQQRSWGAVKHLFHK